MRHCLCTVCALLLLGTPALAAERLDEKVYDGGQPPAAVTPARPAPEGSSGGTGESAGTIRSGGSGGLDVIVVPGQAAPGQVAPDQAIPGQRLPGQSPPTEVAPDQIVPGQHIPGQTPGDTRLVTPVLPTVPAVPVAPPRQDPKVPGAETQERSVTPVQPVQPQATPVGPNDNRNAVPPSAGERVILTPADFLPLTPNKPERAREEAKPAPKKDSPLEPKSGRAGKPHTGPDAGPDAKAETKPAPKADPKAKPDKTMPGKAKPNGDKSTAEKKKGDILRIPADAAQTGKKDFLEGCWKGMVTGDDGRQKRDNMGSRVCFDGNGKGRHYLYDPVLKETCEGPATGTVSGDSLLRVDYNKMQCPSGKIWYPQGDRYMTCRDQGDGAHCSWYFNGNPRDNVRFYRD